MFDLLFAYVYKRGQLAYHNHHNRKHNIHPTSSIGFVRYGGEADLLVGEHSFINSGYITGKVTVGKYCAIGYNVSLIGYTHDSDKPTGKPPLPLKRGAITVKDYAWIGNNAVILPDVIIGEHSIVGANAVVTHSVPNNMVFGGVPARFIREKPGEDA